MTHRLFRHILFNLYLRIARYILFLIKIKSEKYALCNFHLSDLIETCFMVQLNKIDHQHMVCLVKWSICT